MGLSTLSNPLSSNNESGIFKRLKTELDVVDNRFI